MAKLTKDEWLVYGIFRDLEGVKVAERYRHKINAKKRGQAPKEESEWKYAFAYSEDYWTCKRFFPGDLDGDKMQTITDNVWIEAPHTWYDCTGRIFSAGVTFYKTEGGWWCYHFLSRDV